MLGPDASVRTLPVASFVIESMHHALVAARLAAEWGIGVRHGCFCAHPYLLRLLEMSPAETTAYRDEVRLGDHMHVPGATRASASIATTDAEIDRLLDAVRHIATGEPAPIAYEQDPTTGDFYPSGGDALWAGPPACAAAVQPGRPASVSRQHIHAAAREGPDPLRRRRHHVSTVTSWTTCGRLPSIFDAAPTPSTGGST